MAEPTKILEGIFAISKPPSLSSAQVIRDLQQHFVKSRTFSPLLHQTNQRDASNAKRRRRDNDSAFKMGHGGTLDPMATGVLIVAIGRGTKHLQKFLGCSKQYDTVVLFGKSTDTYDIMGKIVSDAPYDQVTRERVEQKLGQFKGTIQQTPPVYSAIKFNGMKAYEFARSGKELPREMASREMQVDECRLVEHYEGGQHDFRWPASEVPEEEKITMQKLIQGVETATQPEQAEGGAASHVHPGPDARQDVHQNDAAGNLSSDKGQDYTLLPKQEIQTHPDEAKSSLTYTAPTETKSTSKSPDPYTKSNKLDHKTKASLHTHDVPTLSAEAAPSPASRISLTVSSGFYVRSFAHDLGIALGTYGTMAELTRSRQQNYVIPALKSQFPELTQTLTYADLEAGEDTWGPIIQAQLQKWMSENPLPGEADADGNVRLDDRDRPRGRNYWNKKGSSGGGSNRHRGSGGGEGNRDAGKWQTRKRKERDS